MITLELIFCKQCEKAMNFYERVFNGQNKEIMN